MTLTRFIDGLTDDLSMHVRSYRPESLEEAYAITTQYANAAYRRTLNKKPTIDNMDKQSFHNRQAKQNNYNNNGNSLNAKPANSNSNNPNHSKTYGSGKFKTRSSPSDDDVSMRTAKSRVEVNNHDNKTERESKLEEKPDTSNQLEESVLESDDDDYFVDDELNFQVK
ncbi:putative uncharacterized protein DDB_G0289963 [Wyeomyia smithii]|uniref:putative uncharacterized protein DDB_G0289963 n=1 Tax=Wyeomyia smithii TaxID=174621 RepID=UPI0024680D1F|nr:putative uncharacterized protein DDB_G0289963 [Wyeomyia smithii]